MAKTSEELTGAIVAATLTIGILALSLLLFLRSFVKRKRVLQQENERMQIVYEQTLLQTRIEIQEQTLRHISQEIHDNIGQVLSLVSLNLNTLGSFDEQKIADTDSLVNKAIDDLRGLSKSLNPDRVQQVGIREAIENQLLQLEKTGMYQTKTLFEADVPDLPPEKTLILYRIFQEILNNIIKHARATEIWVVFSENEKEDIITVTDNGKGFDAVHAPPNGIGLQNIRQRAGMIHASVAINSEPGAGTSVTLSLKKGK